MKERLLVSACLLGSNCKYSGGNNALPPRQLEALRARYALVPVCPELAGGLGVPRTPCERRGERVVSRGGEDVTAAFESGAGVACALCERFSCGSALVKERSPSCGAGTIYDGTFSGGTVRGDGVTAQRLRERGVRLVCENEIEKLL